MRIWLDDEREAPEGFLRFYSSDKLIQHLRQVTRYDGILGVRSNLEEISLDHDLGGDDTGMKVLQYLVESNTWPKVLTIHTANPPARENMLRAANAEAPSWVDIYVIHR